MKNLILVAVLLCTSLVIVSCGEKKQVQEEETGISFKIKKGTDGLELKLDGLNKPEKEEK